MAYQNYNAEERRDLRDLLRVSAAAFADRTAFTEKRDGVTVSHTYREYGADVDALAAALCARGWAGRRMVIAGNNCYAWVVAFLAYRLALLVI